MHSLETHHVLAASLLALVAVACGGSGRGGGGTDPVGGTWNQPNGSIAIPAALGGGSLTDNATLRFDDSVSPATFELTMDLSFMGLTDTLDAHGTYADSGSAITFDFTGFKVVAASGDTSNVASDGSPCVTMNALAGATVCFSTPQTDSYSIANETLTVAINNEIVGAPAAPTTLTLTRSH